MRRCDKIIATRGWMAAGLSWLMVLFILLVPVNAEHYTMQIGSKSNPNAHLFSYDQKFRQNTLVNNIPLLTRANVEFTDATRLSTKMDLRTEANLTEITIDADFIGIGRLGYLVLDPESGDVRHEQSRINHLFAGNFSIEEQILVAKDHMRECGYGSLPCT